MWIRFGPRMINIDGKNIQVVNVKTKYAPTIVVSDESYSLYKEAPRDAHIVYISSGDEQECKTGENALRALKYIESQINSGVSVIDMNSYDDLKGGI